MANKRNINSSEDLQAAIKELERKVKLEQEEIKDDFYQVKENLNPKRVVKNTFSYVAETPEVQRTLVNTAIGFVLGYASKKAAQLLSQESLDRTVENLVNHQLTKLERRDPQGLLSRGIALFRRHTPPNSPIYPLVRYR